MTQIAVAFFNSALKRSGDDGIHFTRYLAPKWLIDHVPMVGRSGGVRGSQLDLPARTGCRLPGVNGARIDGWRR